jgi:hypothetical protein
LLLNLGMTRWLQVEGIPMCSSLAFQFTSKDLVNTEGILLNAELYILTFNNLVCPTHEYYFLVETFAEMIEIFKVLVRFVVGHTPARDLLPNNFLIAALSLDPIIILNNLVDYLGSLTIGWPSKIMSDSYHTRMRVIRSKYNTAFPSHGMRELSRMMRLSSWEIPGEHSVP